MSSNVQRNRDLRQESADHRLQFMYLPFNVFRRYTNVQTLAMAAYLEQKGKEPPHFVLGKIIKKYHSKLMDPEFDWENSILKQLEFNWLNAKDKT